MTIGWGMIWDLASLIAAAEPKRLYGSTYYAGLAVVAVVVVIAAIGFYRVWLEVREDEEPASPVEVLESFQRAHAAGEIDDQELERVTRVLAPGLIKPQPRKTETDTVADAHNAPDS